MKKPHQNSLGTLLMVFALAHAPLASAYDSGPMALSNYSGPAESYYNSVDYYKISCTAGGTTHLNFKIKDTTVFAPQLLNAHITKTQADKTVLSQDVSNMKPDDAPSDVIMQGGNGKYTIAMDTVGTNLALTTPQTYKIEYQCLSADNQVLSSSSSNKKLKNGKTAKTVATCKTKKKTKTTPAIDTDRLHLTLTNITPPAFPLLTAQVINGNKVTTTADYIGDALYSDEVNLKGVEADYRLIVSLTGSNPAKNNAKLYEFQASCLDANNAETGAPTVQLLQDQ